MAMLSACQRTDHAGVTIGRPGTPIASRPHHVSINRNPMHTTCNKTRLKPPTAADTTIGVKHLSCGREES
jgi:hypothetical protein